MTPEEIEDLAYLGTPLPKDNKSLSDLLLWLGFRNLYDFAKRTLMPPEQGKREKSELLEAYRLHKFMENIYYSTGDMWKRIEMAVFEYRKSPSVDNANKILEIIYKIPWKNIGEEVSHDKTQM